MKKKFGKDMLPYWVATFAVMAAALVCTNSAHAIMGPAPGDFAYDLYDITVKKIVQGPIGFVGGIAAVVLGAVNAIKGQMMLAFPCVLGGAALIKSEAIVTSMGSIF